MWPFNKKQQKITVEVNIDYGKLAKEIVKAQEEAKKRRTSRFRGTAMAGLNGMLYLLVTLFSIGAIIGMWMEYTRAAEHSLIAYIGYTILFVFVALYAVLCLRESLGDSDTDAREHFNTNVAVIALVVAFIALIEVVG